MGRIVKHIERFERSRDWYEERGLPYRFGLSLEGPPGTGKTSLVLALASHLRRPVYALNLGSLKGDEELIDAMMGAPAHCVLLIEDIDAADVSRESTASDDDKKPISLSALLNTLDGMLSRDGRIFVLTTNHPERIDPAVLRPGRVNLREALCPIDYHPAMKMCSRFLGDDYRATQFMTAVETPIIPARLQERLLREAGA